MYHAVYYADYYSGERVEFKALLPVVIVTIRELRLLRGLLRSSVATDGRSHVPSAQRSGHGERGWNYQLKAALNWMFCIVYIILHCSDTHNCTQHTNVSAQIANEGHYKSMTDSCQVSAAPTPAATGN